MSCKWYFPFQDKASMNGQPFGVLQLGFLPITRSENAIMSLAQWLTPFSIVGLTMLIGWVAVGMADDRPVRVRPFEPKGHLFLVGGGRITTEMRREFARLGSADQPNSLLVIIPTASESADDPNEDWRLPWADAGFSRVEVLHTRDRTVANSSSFSDVLRQANAVWLSGGDQKKLAEAYVGTDVERILIEKIQSGGVVGGTSAGAAIASRVMIAGGREEPQIERGLDLLPHSILDQHFSQRNRQARLRLAVAQHPHCVGLGIDESTAVIVHQRSLRVIGDGAAHLVFSPTKFQPAAEHELKPDTRWLDWTTIVRTQRERHLAPFPAQVDNSSTTEVAKERAVPQGSLLIVGGGGATDEIWQTFVDRAGGLSARIVILPTAVPAEDLLGASDRSYEANVFRRLGVTDITVLADTDCSVVDSDAFCEKLATATGIWFGGGRQWRFVDAYEGTRAIDGMYQCLARGGIIGGSSAGASIQGELLIRGAPVGNQIMVQDGYRRGFGFLPGVGIDQHFSQRNRFSDLEQTIRQFPSILGLGIDESTALLVEKTQGQVLGLGSVYAFDARKLPLPNSPVIPSARPLQFKSGQVFDLDTLDTLESNR
jgi:cyanophycinase